MASITLTRGIHKVELINNSDGIVERVGNTESGASCSRVRRALKDPILTMLEIIKGYINNGYRRVK